MPTMLPLVIIGIAVAIILTIVVRKFPALAILDVESLPGQKESKFKEQIMKSRVERDLSAMSGFFGRLWLFLSKQAGDILKTYQDRLKKVKASYQAAVKISWSDKQQQIKKLLLEAEEAVRQEEDAEAEEKLLTAISLDQKNLSAFFRLGRLYESQRKWAEARETLNYSLKLSLKKPEAGDEAPEVLPQEIYFLLAEVEKESGNLDAALDNIQEALELEPASPRYLDLILDLSIIKKDRILAAEYWQKLAAVNPDNQKLGDWQKKIEELPEQEE